MTRSSPLLVSSLVLVLASCGARSTLFSADQGSAGGSDAGGNSGAAGSATAGGSGTAGTTTSSTGEPVVCEAIALAEPVVSAPLPSPAHSPEIGFMPGASDVFLSFVAAPPGAPGALQFSRFDPFSSWPPEVSFPNDLLGDVIDYVTGPGPKGAVASIRSPSGAGWLATTFLPEIETQDLPFGQEEPLFVSAIDGRYFLADSLTNAQSTSILVGTVQPGAAYQTEEPVVCVTSAVSAAAVPSGNGFIAGYSGPGGFQSPCSGNPPLPATAVAIMRYESSLEPDTSMSSAVGAVLDLDDPLVHIALAPASFGAWVVFQSSGANARTPPPVFATRLDHDGFLLDPDAPFTPLSPDGQVSSALAVASLGDILAVAWVDSLDPSAPTIIIRLVSPDGVPIALTSIPTGVAWLSGRIRMLPSADLQHLLVAWQGGMDQGTIGLARIDCVNGL